MLNSWADAAELFGAGTIDFTDTLPAFGDSAAESHPEVGATPLSCDFSADDLQNWIDSFEQFATGSINFTDGLNSWADPLTGLFGDYLFSATDPYQTFSDTLAETHEAGNITCDFSADSLQNWVDTFDLFGAGTIEFTDSTFPSWSDTLTESHPGVGATPISVDFSASPDDLNNWNDAFGPGTIGNHEFNLYEDINNWTDALTETHLPLANIQKDFTADALNNWVDTSVALAALIAEAGADALNSWNDTLAAIESRLFTSTDSLNSWVDTGEGFETGDINFTDALTAFSDAATALEAQLVGDTDALANWDDSTSSSSAGQGLSLGFSDNLNVWSDTIGGQFNYYVSPSADDLNSWADILETGWVSNYGLGFSDSLNNWADVFGYTMPITNSMLDVVIYTANQSNCTASIAPQSNCHSDTASVGDVTITVTTRP